MFFVNPYEGQELEHLSVKWAEGYDPGFFTRVEPPRALFGERYDLVLVVSPAKTHTLTIYSLLLKNLFRVEEASNSLAHVGNAFEALR